MWQMFCPGLLLAIAPHLRAPRWRRWSWGGLSAAAAVVASPSRCCSAAVLAEAAPLRFGIVAYQLFVDASRPLYAIGYGLIVAAAIRGRRRGERGGPLVLELGLVSYGIYLLHPVIAALLVRRAGSPLARDTLTAFASNSVLLAALTIPLAMLSWRASSGRGRSGPARAARRAGGHRRPTLPAWPPPPEHAAASGTSGRGRIAFYFVDNRQRYGDPGPRALLGGGAAAGLRV